MVYIGPIESDRIIIYDEEDKSYHADNYRIENIYSELHPNYIYLFLKKKTDMLVYDRKGRSVELVRLPF